jgi:hypothetical protein
MDIKRIQRIQRIERIWRIQFTVEKIGALRRKTVEKGAERIIQGPSPSYSFSCVSH